MKFEQSISSERDMKSESITTELLVWAQVDLCGLNCGQCCQLNAFQDFAKSKIFVMDSNIAEYFMSSRCEKYAAEPGTPYATRNNFIKIFKWWGSAFDLRSFKQNWFGREKTSLACSHPTMHFLRTWHLFLKRPQYMNRHHVFSIKAQSAQCVCDCGDTEASYEDRSVCLSCKHRTGN